MFRVEFINRICDLVFNYLPLVTYPTPMKLRPRIQTQLQYNIVFLHTLIPKFTQYKFCVWFLKISKESVNIRDIVFKLLRMLECSIIVFVLFCSRISIYFLIFIF